MKREFEYLLAAVRSFFQPGAPLPSSESLDRSVLKSLASRHAVTPFLYRAEGGADLRVAAQEAARFDLVLSGELVKLLRLCEQQQIGVIPLKGPVLAAAFYGDQSLRTSTDLDLLVRPQDLLRMKLLLEGIGYRLESVLHWPVATACFRCRDSQLSFSDPTDRVSADVHWRLLPEYFPTSFDELEIWKNPHSVPWAGMEVSALAPERLLLFLCVHGTKHVWERLGWICDVARFLQMESDVDWSRIFTSAARTGTSRMVSTGLILASDLLGVEVPPAAAARVSKDAKAGALAHALIRRFHTHLPAPTSPVDAALFSMRMFERTSQSARFVFGIFFTPTEAEYRALQLPPGLHWIYYLFRPARLSFKYVRRLARL